MPIRLWTVRHLVFCCVLGLSASLAQAADDTAEDAIKSPAGDDAKQDEIWDVDVAHGPTWEQSIDVTEGTWVNLDISPDGRQIAFDLLGDLYMMPIDDVSGDADGIDAVAPIKLTSGVAWDMQPRFSPDGKSIAFTSDRNGKSKRAGDNIWIIDAEGQNLRQVTNETYRLLNGPAWSPDGQYIVARKHFSSRRSLGAGEIWMFHHQAASLDAMGGVQLTKRRNDQKDVNEPICSRDGKYLYYSQDATSGNTFEYDKDSNKQIYVIKRLELATGKTETYISGPGGACRPTPSPSGEQIAFVRRVGAKTGLHLFDTRSGAVRLVYDGLERDMQEAWAIHGVYPSFAWMPDGTQIVVWAKGKIRQIDVATGAATVIPFRIQDSRTITKSLRFPIEVGEDEFDVRMLRDVQTSPSGDQVAYQALGYIYVRDLPGGEPRRLTQQTDHFEFFPSYSRDGKYLVYSTWNDQRLGAIRVASIDPHDQESWKVTSEPGHYLTPVMSPDGETVVFRKSGSGQLRSSLWSQQPGIYRIPTRGGEAKRIAESGISPQFGKDSSRLFLITAKGGPEADNRCLCSVPLEGGDVREHYVSSWATDFRVSPDEQWIAFVERFHVYVAPMVSTGAVITVGPNAKGLPTRKVSHEAGDWVHFSADAQHLHWALGPDLYTVSLDEALHQTEPANADSDSTDETSDGHTADVKPEVTEIGFRAKHDRPAKTWALTGGTVITMRGDEVIEDGTILIAGNRIQAIGNRADVEIPEDAVTLDIRGQVVLPGFVDTHAHGAQATNGITPQHSWIDYARLSFGVTTIHDPSNHTHSIFAASEMAKAGIITSPRTFSTGTILYGATSANKAEIRSLDDARFHLRRMQAVGAFSVKSYNQPRRDQRQQVVAAAREMGMMVVPEGGSTYMHNMTMIVDGHTGIEHTLPVQSAYADVMALWKDTGVGYTPTLSVAYGGISGEQYWYEVDDLWLHPRLQEFIPPHILVPRSRRRNKAPHEDYNHIRVAEIAKQVVEQGGLVQAGGHGQLNGICTHWELWSFVQGGMTPMQALRCGTLYGARYIGLDGDLGSLEQGKLADLIVIKEGFDPRKEIRHSEQIQYVVANGRAYQADRMHELGSPVPRAPFFWQAPGHGGVSRLISHTVGCSCGRH